MNSIINPWVFYWISVSEGIKVVLLIVECILLVAFIILCIATGFNADNYSFKDEDVINEVKLTIKVAIVSLIVAVLCCAVPDSNTCYKMLAANMFTQDNINSATDYVTDVIDYAVDKVKELQPADSTKE